MAKRTEAARKTLIALPVGGGAEVKLSAAAQRAIAAMKSRLGDLVGAYMRCAAPDRDAGRIERDLKRLAGAFELKPGFYTNAKLPKNFGHYGFDLGVKVKRSGSHPNLLGIVVDFGIKCGSDAMLLLFSTEGGAWREVLRRQSAPYDSIDGAFGSFGYAISPPDATGRWYVVTKTVTPACISFWSTIRYAVLRRGTAASAPRVIYENEDPIWWGGEDFGHLSAQALKFEVRFHAGSIDTGVHNRIWIRHFAIDGDSVRRIQPVAQSAADFVDEWIVSPWTDASQWTAPEARAMLAPLHDRLHDIHGFDYDSERPCADGRNRVQIGLLDSDAQVTYFLSVSGRAGYVMTAVSTTLDPACTQENGQMRGDQ